MIESDQLVFLSRGGRHQPIGILHDLGLHFDPARRFPLAGSLATASFIFPSVWNICTIGAPQASRNSRAAQPDSQ